MAEKLVQLKKKGGGVSGLTITDTFDSIRYNPETAAGARIILEYDATNCVSCVVNVTRFNVSRGSSYVEIRGDQTVLYKFSNGQTGSYTINNPSQYSIIMVNLSYPVNSSNQVVGNVVRTY